MLCYKDMTFCVSKTCTNLECPRNTKREDFHPDDFWKDKVAYSVFEPTCKDYTGPKKENQ